MYGYIDIDSIDSSTDYHIVIVKSRLCVFVEVSICVDYFLRTAVVVRCFWLPGQGRVRMTAQISALVNTAGPRLKALA